MKLGLNKIDVLTLGDDHEVNILPASNSIYTTLVTRMGYKLFNINDSLGVQVSSKALERNFKPVEDFNYLSYNKKMKKFITYYEVYKHISQDYYILIDINLDDQGSFSYEQKDEVMKEGIFKVCNIYYKPEMDLNIVVKNLNDTFIFDSSSAKKISIVLRTSHGFIFKQHKIEPLSIDVDKMYNDDFKPVHEHIVDRLNNTSKGVVMLHGKAGAGKTNYIKHLTTLVPEKNFVFIPSAMIQYLTDPSFISQLIDHKGSILVLEDCENYIKDRELSQSTVVSTILNLADGILSDVLGVQIICTFNNDIGEIDPALLRKGRLIDEYKFGYLESKKVKSLCEELNVDIEGDVTLADIFNAKDNSHRTENKRRKIGF